MGDLASSDLPGGYTGDITADQMNRLRDDLFKHHDHSTDKGGAIAHSDLTDGVALGTLLSHLLISKHAQGTGTGATPDNPGGAQGVHGLGSTHYVLGIAPYQHLIQIGTGTTDRWNSDDEQQRGRGTFASTYKEAPFVLCTPLLAESATVGVYQRLVTSFAVKFRFIDGSSYQGSQQNIPFIWIAFGEI